ncbi:MAG: hypothetical protein CMO78_00140 [Verrucomicrobiales bacterium]|nr:hypothetical protein [Verrucomicrobiales bacterium]
MAVFGLLWEKCEVLFMPICGESNLEKAKLLLSSFNYCPSETTAQQELRPPMGAFFADVC